MKKDHGQVQANWANRNEKDCFKWGKKGHVAKECRSKDVVKCEECEGEHLTTKHNAVVRAENRGEEFRVFQEYRAKINYKDKEKDKDKKQKPKKDQKQQPRGDKKVYSLEQVSSDSSSSESEADQDDERIDAYQHSATFSYILQ